MVGSALVDEIAAALEPPPAFDEYAYDVPPPPLAPGGEYDFSKDRRYAGAVLPNTESLATTLDRVQPYWDAEIAPCLKRGETLLVAAHGNSLRVVFIGEPSAK